MNELDLGAAMGDAIAAATSGKKEKEFRLEAGKWYYTAWDIVMANALNEEAKANALCLYTDMHAVSDWTCVVLIRDCDNKDDDLDVYKPNGMSLSRTSIMDLFPEPQFPSISIGIEYEEIVGATLHYRDELDRRLREKE